MHWIISCLKPKTWLTFSLPALAVDIVGVVTVAEEAEPALAAVHQAVGAAGQEALALVALVVEVALLLVAHGLGAGLAGVAAPQAQAPAILAAGSASVVSIGVLPLGRLGHPHPLSVGRGPVLGLSVLCQRSGPKVPLGFSVQKAVTSVVVGVDVVPECVIVHRAPASVLELLSIGWINQVYHQPS